MITLIDPKNMPQIQRRLQSTSSWLSFFFDIARIVLEVIYMVSNSLLQMWNCLYLEWRYKQMKFMFHNNLLNCLTSCIILLNFSVKIFKQRKWGLRNISKNVTIWITKWQKCNKGRRVLYQQITGKPPILRISSITPIIQIQECGKSEDKLFC